MDTILGGHIYLTDQAETYFQFYVRRRRFVLVEEIVKRLREQADKIDQVMKRRGISFIECQLMRQAAELIASQAEELAREKNARLSALDDAFEALKIAEDRAIPAETDTDRKTD